MGGELRKPRKLKRKKKDVTQSPERPVVAIDSPGSSLPAKLIDGKRKLKKKSKSKIAQNEGGAVPVASSALLASGSALGGDQVGRRKLKRKAVSTSGPPPVKGGKAKRRRLTPK